MDRRAFMRLGGYAASAALIAKTNAASAQHAGHAPEGEQGAKERVAEPTAAGRGPAVAPGGQPAVITPNGHTLKWRVQNGVKVGHLVAAPVQHEFAPGLTAECWGYNGGTPGPTLEAVEGDRVRIYVTNKLPEPTSRGAHGRRDECTRGNSCRRPTGSSLEPRDADRGDHRSGLLRNAGRVADAVSACRARIHRASSPPPVALGFSVARRVTR